MHGRHTVITVDLLRAMARDARWLLLTRRRTVVGFLVVELVVSAVFAFATVLLIEVGARNIAVLLFGVFFPILFPIQLYRSSGAHVRRALYAMYEVGSSIGAQIEGDTITMTASPEDPEPRQTKFVLARQRRSVVAFEVRQPHQRRSGYAFVPSSAVDKSELAARAIGAARPARR